MIAQVGVEFKSREPRTEKRESSEPILNHEIPPLAPLAPIKLGTCGAHKPRLTLLKGRVKERKLIVGAGPRPAPNAAHLKCKHCMNCPRDDGPDSVWR
ncbi:MAG TPA: hypothetical protein DIW44_03275 [Anaerolineaceae bacterium]|nr:hypothetical protein [Anaerolineaceae bacterium]